MRLKLPFLLLILLSACSFLLAQRIDKETITYQVLREPLFPTETSQRNFNIVVISPYNITKDNLLQQSKEDYQRVVDHYQQNLEVAKLQHQERIKDYDEEVKKLTEKYKVEAAEYSKLKPIEKLAIQQPPVLRIPSRPELNIPFAPKYKEPDLRDALIVDNKVLASQINVEGFMRNGNNLDITVEMTRTNFQDNAGKTYANQPTRIIGKLNGVVKLDKTYLNNFEQVATSPTNEINLNSQEKTYLQKVIRLVNEEINTNFGYKNINSAVTLETVKNKGEYDDLEKAYIYVTTNLKKMQAKSDYPPNKVAIENMQRGISLWEDALKKINYNDKKALFNDKIARYLYFNLIRLSIALGNKEKAENYLNQLQEHLVDIKLNYDDSNELKALESQIYNN